MKDGGYVVRKGEAVGKKLIRVPAFRDARMADIGLAYSKAGNEDDAFCPQQ